MSEKTTGKSSSMSYRSAGVDIDAGNALVERIKPAVKSTRRPGANAELGGFGGVFDLAAAGFTDPVLVAANDGVGTKLKIAIECGVHDTVGIDLVAMCANDLVAQGATPLFFLDYYATGKLENDIAAAVIEGIAAGCREAGCALIGGETAEMPGMYREGDYDLAGFCVGAAERGQLRPVGDIVEGDILVGLRASGVHSNGYSLVRKIVSLSKRDWSAPAPFDNTTSLGEALLRPTRIYVRQILAAMSKGINVKALAHITGGGFTENIPRMLPADLAAAIDCSTIAVPPVFGWLAKEGELADEEMLRTFNCGVGMVLIVSAQERDLLISELKNVGEEPVILGHLVARRSNAVVYTGTLKT